MTTATTPEKPAAKLTPEERSKRLDELLKRQDRERLEQLELEGHPNPAMEFWLMLPGRYYPAVFSVTPRGKVGKLLGYEIKNAVGRPKFMPVQVARRLLKDGKIHYWISDSHIRVNEDWKACE